MDEFEKLYTVEEIAAMTRLTDRTIRNHLRAGTLKGRKIGGQWRFTANDINNYMDRNEVTEIIRDDIKQFVQDFVDGVNTEIKGETQVCTIIDLYISNEEAKAKADEFCGEMGEGKKYGKIFRFYYTYDQTEGKARFIFFAPPETIGRVMEMLK